MKKKTKIIISVVIIVILVITSYIFIIEPMTWGEGDLSISIELDKEEYEINDTIHIKFTYKNVGNTNLRILHWVGPGITIYNSNQSIVRCLLPEKKSASPTNDDLIVIRVGESKTYDYRIDKYSWDLKENDTYKIVANYKRVEYETISLPYWKGEITSNEEYFEIL